MEKIRDVELGLLTLAPVRLRVHRLDGASIKRLERSIEDVGLLHRIVVRPVGDGRFEVVDGARRLKALRRLHEKDRKRWETAPVLVKELTAGEAIVFQLVSTENRQGYTPFEKARGYRLAWKTGRYTRTSDLAAAVGRGAAAVSRAIGIFNRFPRKITEAFERGELRQAHLNHFWRLEDRETMLRLWRAIKTGELTGCQAREKAHRIDDYWLPGDREKLRDNLEADPVISPLLGDEIRVANLMNKSRLTIEYTDKKRFWELVGILARRTVEKPKGKRNEVEKPVKR